jgi:small subunit ribosomal protein S6
MPVNNYESLVLLDPTKVGSDVDAAKATIHGILEKYGSEILASRKWDDRKLAYAIDGHKKGLYYLVHYKVDSLKVKQIELDFRLNENVLRHMTSNIDPKWVEEMLAVAKDETKFGLQLLADDNDPSNDGFDSDMGDRPRRRRNVEAEVGKE